LFEYHEMTPLDLNLCAQACADKAKNDQESEMFYSYINAYWQRVETLKSFDEMLGRPKEVKVMTPDEMLATVMGIHNELGGTTEGR
jgi:hypothetical protein